MASAKSDLLAAQCRAPAASRPRLRPDVMDSTLRKQLLSLSTEFYRAHAAGFDASRGHQPWPGWGRLLDDLPPTGADQNHGRANDNGVRRLSVLDVGCGNARLATFLSQAGYALRYVGVDANKALLDAGRERLDPELQPEVDLLELDFLATSSPGEALPSGPFDFIALFGVLHHVPGRDWRQALMRALAERLAPTGLLAVAAWQFGGRERFARRTVEWNQVGPILGEPLDSARLEVGDVLLRFGSDPDLPPRYCHQVSDAEFEGMANDLVAAGIATESVADFRADGAEGDLNRYGLFRRTS